MRNLIVTALSVVSVCLSSVQAQPMGYDLYYVLPGEAGTGGVDVGFNTPDLGKADDLGLFDVMAKYVPVEGLELGARTTLGFLHDGEDDLSALTLGAKLSVGEMSAVVVNVGPVNTADEVGLSMGVLNSLVVRDLGVNSRVMFAFLDGYTDQGALIDALVQPVLPLGDRSFAYLDIMVATDTEKPADRLSLQLGPNLDFELLPGLVLNGGVQFSLYSGDQITHDTDLGVVVSLFKTAALW